MFATVPWHPIACRVQDALWAQNSGGLWCGGVQHDTKYKVSVLWKSLAIPIRLLVECSHTKKWNKNSWVSFVQCYYCFSKNKMNMRVWAMTYELYNFTGSAYQQLTKDTWLYNMFCSRWSALITSSISANRKLYYFTSSKRNLKQYTSISQAFCYGHALYFYICYEHNTMLLFFF